MQEKAMDFNGELRKRGKSLEEISHDEFIDIADQIGLRKKKK